MTKLKTGLMRLFALSLLYLGSKFIASNGRYISNGPQPIIDISKYISFIYDSIEYYEFKEQKEFPAPKWIETLEENFSI
jgi:hypothetical protein